MTPVTGLITLLLFFLPATAHAYAFVSEFCNLNNIITGSAGKIIAAVGVVGVGVGFFTGRVSWGLLIGTCAGIGLMQGAPTIVSAISGKETFVCEEKTYNSDCINGPCNSCPNGRTGVTCQYYLPGYTSNGCDEAAGYIEIGDTCYRNCSLETNGIDPITVNHAANQSLDCSAANFTGNIIYTCNNGTLTINNNSCACVGNFTGTSCTSCTAGYLESSSCTECDSNYTMIEGSCQKDCTTSSELVGISSGIKLIGNGTIPCNSPYSKTIDYSCVGGNLNFSSTCDSCMANYEMVDGVCQAVNCSVPSTVGTTTATVNLASGTLDCNKDGYLGGPLSYTCSGGTFEVTSNACSSLKCTCTNCTTDDTSVYGEIIHKFTTNGTLNCSQTVEVAKVLVVAGGGSGGSGTGSGGGGGGGGGGGVVYSDSYPALQGSYNVIVGAGGSAVTAPTAPDRGSAGITGGNSTFDTLTAKGGGGGGAWNNGDSVVNKGIDGGSGGGGGGPHGIKGTTNQAAQTNETNHHGYDGSNATGDYFAAGGGGGAGGAPTSYAITDKKGDNGGAGISYSITGSPVIYAAGGGGYGFNSGGLGGSGGIGGKGSTGPNTAAPSVSPENYGSGGGGSNKMSSGSGVGGVVIVRYAK